MLNCRLDRVKLVKLSSDVIENAKFCIRAQKLIIVTFLARQRVGAERQLANTNLARTYRVQIKNSADQKDDKCNGKDGKVQHDW